MLVAVDVGGTFTDVVYFEDGEVSAVKVVTTKDQSEGVAAATRGTSTDIFLHGTTAATNALLEGRGARVALITDPGFEDLIEIARQDRPALYDSAAERPDPLVGRELRYGFSGDVEELLDWVKATDPEVVTVGFLDSHTDDSSELLVETVLTGPVPVLRSSAVSPEIREYERLATTVLSGYLTPSVSGYLARLDAALPMTTKLVMTSAGGLIPFDATSTAAGRLVLSGPAGGVVAAAALGRAHGHDSVLSFDMGGTSTDVCRITGGLTTAGTGHVVAGRVNRVPSVPVRTIGAGGGSIGWIDGGGALRVGPRSAGSNPGPAAYGRGGTEPTVTDANLLLRNIPVDLAMGGTLTLDAEAGRSAIGRIAGPMGMTIEEAARGMIEVVDSHMEHALRSVSVEEGADPRGAVLVAFGGAGGLHATRLASRLGIRRVLIPPHSGVFSALGLLMAPPRSDLARTVMLVEGDIDLAGLTAQLERESASRFRAVFGVDPTQVSSSVDVRYRGQSHEVEVPNDGEWQSVRSRFETDHATRFGFSRTAEPIEAVNIRATCLGTPPLSWGELPQPASNRTPTGADEVWHRDTLPPGFSLTGPAVVVEPNSAVLLEPGDVLTVLEDDTLELIPR